MTRTLILAACVAALPAHALAHVGLAQDEAEVGAGFKAVLAVPHGCDGQATTAIAVTLPDGFVDAKPMPKAGFALAVVQHPYARPYAVHGETLTGGAAEIRWTGGRLEDGWYDEFTIHGTFADGAPLGSAAFPVRQTCADGTVIDWADVAAEGSDPHALAHPAPVVTVSAADPAGGGHDHHHGMAMDGDHAAMGGTAAPDAADGPSAAGGSARLGDLTVSGGFARAMLPGAPAAGGYLTIRNEGSAPDVLVSVASPLAGAAGLHAMTMDGDVMRMRAMPDGIEIPAGGTVALRPGGFHVMFERVTTPFRPGMTVPVRLTFAHAGAVEVMLPVAGAAATGPVEVQAAP